ncbi:MAG: c-type cytochrome [Deltaproteobacteria bacterium]
MLTKSAARAFFLAGTAVCVVAFIGLTVDTFQRLPTRTHADQITPAVARGKDLWDSNNCMGCHTILGEGAYYAPELTRVFERRGPEFIRAQLHNPEAMFPGQRRMTNYHFTSAQIDDLVAFLRWIGTVDTNGFPARPTLGAFASADRIGPRPQVFSQICVACHSIGGRGGAVGPALDTVGDRFNAEYLARWLRDPPSVRPRTAMPRLPLTDTQINELVAFLGRQRAEVRQ